jgi:hypothetical protein
MTLHKGLTQNIDIIVLQFLPERLICVQYLTQNKKK